MKKTILATVCAVLVMASGAFAFDGTITQTIDIFSPPITVQKDSDIKVVIDKLDGVNSYNDASPQWEASQTTMGKVQAIGDISTPFALTYPTQIATEKGAETATITHECRALTTGYPANKTDGAACGTSFTSHGTTGKAFFSLVPTAVDLSAGAVNGTYNKSFVFKVSYL